MKNFKMAYFALGAMFYNSAIANTTACGTDGKKACVSNPGGIISENAKIKGAVEALNWVLAGAAVIGAIVFGIKAAKELSDNRYVEAIGPGAGAVVCGAVLYIAYSFVK